MAMQTKFPLRLRPILAAATACCIASPLAAQDIDMEDTVFSGDYLSVGVGVAISPSYSGSDDYVLWPVPIAQGSLGGVDLNARAGGLALDFLPDPDEGPGFDLGIAARLRSDRASQIEDEVVKSLGELDRAIEVGPSFGVSFPKVLHGYDSLTLSTDVMWDINGAHDGRVIVPSIAYFTPLSRGIAASLSASAEYGDADFNRYYYQVTPAQSAATGGVLPAYQTDGGGFTKAGVNLLLGFDLDGDLTNGGLGLVVMGGYSRVLGDAADTPFTSVVGTRDQFMGAVGVGYTF